MWWIELALRTLQCFHKILAESSFPYSSVRHEGGELLSGTRCFWAQIIANSISQCICPQSKSVFWDVSLGPMRARTNFQDIALFAIRISCWRFSEQIFTVKILPDQPLFVN